MTRRQSVRQCQQAMRVVLDSDRAGVPVDPLDGHVECVLRCSQAPASKALPQMPLEHRELTSAACDHPDRAGLAAAQRLRDGFVNLPELSRLRAPDLALLRLVGIVGHDVDLSGAGDRHGCGVV